MLYYHKLNSTDVNPIPKTFTSDTSISGYVCSASSYYSGRDYPWHVWKQDYTTSEWAWWTGSVTVSESNPCWVQIQVPDAFVPSSITTWNEASTPANYQTAVFQGSNDGTTWTDIVQMPANVNTAGYKNTAVCSTNTAFSYFRLYVTASYAGSSGVSIQAIKITKKQYSSDGFSEDFHHAVGYESAYDAGCGLSRIPTEGLVLYAPLSSDQSTAETGQTLTKTGTPTFDVVDGIACVYFDGSSGYTLPAIDVSTYADGFTISAWLKPDKSGDAAIISRRSDTYQAQYWVGFSTNYMKFWAASSSVTANISVSTSITTFVHAAWVYTNGVFDLYINGTRVGGGSGAPGTATGDTGIGVAYYSSENYKGNAAAVRIYNRAITSDEIAQLAAEFTPTA